MTRRRSIVPLFCSLAALTAAMAGSPTAGTPLQVHTLGPLFVARPSAADVMSPAFFGDDAWLARANVQWGNVWILKPDYYMFDGEWTVPTLTVGHRWSTNCASGLRIPVVIRSAGFADSTIERFHGRFSLPNHQRDEFPRNQCIVEVQNEDKTFRLDGGHTGIGDIELLTSWQVSAEGNLLPRMVMQAAWQLPTGNKDQLEGTGDSCFTASILLSKRVATSPLSLFAGGTVTYRMADEIAAIELQSTAFSGLLGCELTWDTWTIIVQGTEYTPMSENYYAFSRNALEASAGIRKQIANSVLELSITENIKYFSGGADIGAQLGWGWTF